MFDDRQFYFPGRLPRRISWLQGIDQNLLNNRLISLAYRRLSDVAIVTGGHRISAKTIRRMKDKGIITVLWTTDPPLNFQPIIDVAPSYDHIFCQGSEAVELLKKAGIEGAQWLPMACDPLVHRPIEMTKKEQEEYCRQEYEKSRCVQRDN